MSDVKPSNGKTFDVTDSLGRKIVIKTLGPADTLNLLEAAGKNSDNISWVRMATILASVRKIDEVPMPATTKKDQLLAVADRLGDEGIGAVYAAMFPEASIADPEEAQAAVEAAETEQVATAKN